MSPPFASAVPGKMQRPVPVNNKMVKHKNRWWEIKTINTRQELSESGQDYRDSTSPPGGSLQNLYGLENPKGCCEE